jgi:hypothetical protein
MPLFQYSRRPITIHAAFIYYYTLSLSPPGALRQGVARAAFDLVLDVMFQSTHHPRPSDRVSRGR